MSKPIIFTIMMLMVSLKVLSEESTLETQEVYSENKEYRVIVTGAFYEGFVNDQSIALVNAKGDTLWKQVVPDRFLILPSVSNNGDVAITHREVKIYDKYMRLKGVYPFKERISPYYVVDYSSTVHGFSIKGDRYFIFTFVALTEEDVSLLCLTDSAKEVSNLYIGKYKPSKILFYPEMLITHDCRYRGTRYTNGCYVYDLNSKLIWQYKPESKRVRDWKVILDSKKGILNITDKSATLLLNLDSLRTSNKY